MDAMIRFLELAPLKFLTKDSLYLASFSVLSGHLLIQFLRDANESLRQCAEDLTSRLIQLTHYKAHQLVNKKCLKRLRQIDSLTQLRSIFEDRQRKHLKFLLLKLKVERQILKNKSKVQKSLIDMKNHEVLNLRIHNSLNNRKFSNRMMNKKQQVMKLKQLIKKKRTLCLQKKLNELILIIFTIKITIQSLMMNQDRFIIQRFITIIMKSKAYKKRTTIKLNMFSNIKCVWNK